MEEDVCEVEGIIRGQGQSQQYAETGLERLVVHIEKGCNQSTTNSNSIRVPVTLVIGGHEYRGGLLLRSSPEPLVSLSPDLIDGNGNATNLANVFQQQNLSRNTRLAVSISGVRIELSPA